jgi:GTP:adenosylcobinamide-phosphate guanylyltransferase
MPAIVLAAGGGRDKLALAQAVADKALLPVGGRPMIDLMLDALHTAQRVSEVVVVADEGSPLVEHLAGREGVSVAFPSGPGFLDSMSAGMERFADRRRVLVCSGDIPLVTAEGIDDFVGRCDLYPTADLCYSIIRAEACNKQFPGGRRTTVKLREGEFTGGNIVALSPEFLERERARFEQVFALRKSPLKLCALLGWGLVLKLMLRLASVAAVVERAKSILNCEVAAIETPCAAIGFDVDKPEDLAAVEGYLGRTASYPLGRLRRPHPPPS